MRSIVVQDDMDYFSRRDVTLNSVEEADKLLMSMALHVLADDSAVENIERREPVSYTHLTLPTKA